MGMEEEKEALMVQQMGYCLEQLELQSEPQLEPV
jgi:hypothetical protein